MQHVLEEMAETLLPHLNQMSKAHIADILDSQFLLHNLLTIAKNALAEHSRAHSFSELFKKEAVEEPILVTELQHLDALLDLDSLCSPELAKQVIKEVKLAEMQPTQHIRSLQSIDNPLYESYTKDLKLSQEIKKEKGKENQKHKHFEERYHWHTMKKLSDDYDRTKCENMTKSFWATKRKQQEASFTMR